MNGAGLNPGYYTGRLAGFHSGLPVYDVSEKDVPSDNSSGVQGCSVYKSAHQSVNNITPTTLSWDLENYDSNDFHDNSINNSRITIPDGMGGVYLCGIAMVFTPAIGSTLDDLRVRWFRNGSLDGIGFRMGWKAGAEPPGGENMEFTMIDNLIVSAGDYLEVQVYQNSGDTATVLGGAINSYIWVQRLGATP